MSMTSTRNFGAESASCDTRFSVRSAAGSLVSLLNDDVPTSPSRPLSITASSDYDDAPSSPLSKVTSGYVTPPLDSTFTSPAQRHAEVPRDLRLPGFASIVCDQPYLELTPPATPVTNGTHIVTSPDYYLAPITPCTTAPSSPRVHQQQLVTPVRTPYPAPTPLPITQIKATLTEPKRKHVCTWEGCDKAFTTSGHLSRHTRIHTGEKRYKCDLPTCNQYFARHDNMRQHYRTHSNARSRAKSGRVQPALEPLVVDAQSGHLPPHHRHRSVGGYHPYTAVPRSAAPHPHPYVGFSLPPSPTTPHTSYPPYTAGFTAPPSPYYM
ncbi:transcriptional repressor [Tieghemiomyces parasiticus]|uniref:Transcriptional repressor n=1 Tax=Tieghemiomyces parasiticus TaxID=78921 RepID=A0A9W8DMY3_9FUNG|nr:transcriptional repressor [Tieghemiomyces parasiticus]